MSSENLARLAHAGQLKAEPPARKEFEGLVKLGRMRLADSRKDLSLESRFDLAYGAAYAFSLAALRWNGYRSENRYDDKLLSGLYGAAEAVLAKVAALPAPK